MRKPNLHSPTTIFRPCDLNDLSKWLATELELIDSKSVRAVVKLVSRNLTDFVQFPKRAMLLWNGCDRVRCEGSMQKLHTYPDEIRILAKQGRIRLDSRPNGPAIAAYLLAEGARPKREGSTNAWSIHHVYSGKFPYAERNETLHAQKDGMHFTQSAGLIAVHPIADAICDELPSFSWFLRAEAYLRFGYDPDKVFGRSHNQHGFIPKRKTVVFFNSRYS